MQVDVTLRIDCIDADQKEDLLLKLEGEKLQRSNVCLPDTCDSITQKSIRIKWESFDDEWDLYVINFIKLLSEENVTGVFGFACIWGDRGWNEYWSFIDSRLDRFEKWNNKSVSRLLPRYQTEIEMTVLNRVRKDRLLQHKLGNISGIDINEFELELAKKQKFNTAKQAFSDELEALDIPEVITEHWQSHDSVWLKCRLKEWHKNVFPRLGKSLSPREREKLITTSGELYKEIFLFGTIWGTRLFLQDEFNFQLKPFDKNEKELSTALCSDAWPLIIIWLHPKANVLIPKLPVFLEYLLSHGMSMKQLRKDSSSLFAVPEVDYGSMNGNEEFVMELLVPARRKNEILKITDINGQEIETNVGLDRMLISKVANDTQIELTGDARFFPYAEGQFLWEHVSCIMEYEPEFFFLTKDMDESTQYHLKETQKSFQSVISRILDFENRTDKSSKRPSTIAMVERLLGMYEIKEFSDPMIELWDKTKKDLKRQLSWNKRKFYMTFADVDADRQNMWSQKKQEHIISMWRQMD